MKNNPCRPLGGRMPRFIWACLVLVLLVGAPIAAQMPGEGSGLMPPTSAPTPATPAAEPPDPARTVPPLILNPSNPAPANNPENEPPAGAPATPADVAAQPAPESPASENLESLPLTRGPADTRDGSDGNKVGGGFWRIVPALLLVLALLAGCVWAARKYLPGAVRLGGGGSSSMRVLGRTHVSPRQSIVLVKIGRRVLVVGATAERLTALDSIIDPLEVSELVGQAEAGRSNSATSSFRSALKEADETFGPLDDVEDASPATPPDIVSLSQQAARRGRGTMAMPDDLDDDGENADVGRIRSELDQLRRKVRDAIGRSDR